MPNKKPRIPRITLRKPAGKRISWRLLRDWKTVPSKEIDAINIALHNKEIPPKRAQQMAEEVLKNYKQKHIAHLIVPAYTPENERLAERYIEEVLSLRHNREPQAASDRIMRAAKAVGKFSIHSASLKDLMKALDKWDSRPYNDRVGALNQLLRFAGRTDRLPTKKVINPSPRFLTLDEFKRVAPHLKDPSFSILCWAAFGTGARFGELFSLGKIEDGQVFIDSQIKVRKSGKKTNFVKSGTKNSKSGWTAIVPDCRAELDKWIKLAWEDKIRLRTNTKLSEVFKEACKKEFPSTQDKWCTFHDLRHSYARYCLDNGKALEDVREWLRDTIRVVETYYLGWGRGRRKGF